MQKCAACTKARQKAHGAPIQCTKGKCAKSFHISCARDGENGVLYSVVREVEKEVVLVNAQPLPLPPSPAPVSSTDLGQLDISGEEGMQWTNNDAPQISPPPNNTEPQVLKTIKKNEVQVLCTQHNPVSTLNGGPWSDTDRSPTRLSLRPRRRISKTRFATSLSRFRPCHELKSVSALGCSRSRWFASSRRRSPSRCCGTGA